MEYKPSQMHLQTNDLLRLSKEVGSSPIDDRMINDNLFVVTAQSKWYACIVEFLTNQHLVG